MQTLDVQILFYIFRENFSSLFALIGFIRFIHEVLRC